MDSYMNNILDQPLSISNSGKNQVNDDAPPITNSMNAPPPVVQNSKAYSLRGRTVPLNHLNAFVQSGNTRMGNGLSFGHHPSSTYYTRSKSNLLSGLNKQTPLSKNQYLICVGGNQYCQVAVLDPTDVKNSIFPVEFPYKEAPKTEVKMKGGKKRRFRRNFEYPVKKKILELYAKFQQERSGQSIRTIAMTIYNIMSKDEGFEHSFKNILTLLYNHRQKQT